MPTWPVSLPQKFEASSYKTNPENNVITTDMDTGPSKIRRRFTAKRKIHSGRMVMSKYEFDTFFLPFFETTISDGTVEFSFPDPFDDSSTIEVRWIVGGRPYEVKQYSPVDVVVSFAIEELA